MVGPRLNILIGANTKTAEAGIKRVTDSFKSFKRIATAIVAGKLVKDMANFGKELSLMADRTGMSIEKLSTLRNIFMSAGSGAKGFQQTVERINAGLMGLKRGESHLAAQLAPLGINPFGKTADQILEEIADAAQAQLSMGRSRESVLDYLTNVIWIDPATAQRLMKGRAFWLAEEARLLNKVGKVSGENDANLTRLNQSLGELNAAWTNMTANIIGFVAPAIIALADGLSYLFKEIGEGNPLAIGGAVAGTIALSSLTKMLLGWATKTLGGWLFGTGAATAVGAGTTGVGSAVAGIGAGTLALGAAFIGIITDSIWEIYNYIKSGEMKGPLFAVWNAFWELVFDSFTGAWKWIKEKGKGTWDGIKELYVKARTEAGSAQTFYDFGTEGAREEAKRKTRLLFTDPTMDVPVVYGEPLISDEDYEKPVKPEGYTVNNYNHFEGSNFGSDLPETKEAMTDAMNLCTAAQVTG